VLPGDSSHPGVGDSRELTCDQAATKRARRGRGVVHEVLVERHERVRLAVVENLTALAEAHEAIARTPGSIASRAERGDVAALHEPMDDLIERSLVRDVELLGVMHSLLLRVVLLTDACPLQGNLSAQL